MALRNAFDLLATEGTLRQLLRQLSFARTPTDQLRVVVENGLSVTNSVSYNGGNTGSMMGAANQPVHWGPLSWNTVDSRYQYGEQLVGNYIQNRERWTIS